jgi:drug/metabolite transporter, DME family
LIVAAAVLWGTIGPFSVWATRTGLHALEVAFWRAALATLPFAILTLRNVPRLEARAITGVMLFGAVGIATMYGAFFQAVERIGPGIAAVLLYTGPAWVAVFEWVSGRAKSDLRSVFALVLTIAGVILLTYDFASARINVAGVLYGLVSGFAFSTHFTVAPRYITRMGAPFVYALAMATAAALLFAIAAPGMPANVAWLPLSFLALFATFGASLLFARGIVQTEPVRAAITSTVEPVVATILGIAVLGAVLAPQQMLGASLVICGVVAIMIRR